MDLDDHLAVGGQQVGATINEQERLAPEFLILRRRHIDQVKRLAPVILEYGKTIGSFYQRISVQLTVAQISAHGLHRLPVEIDKMGKGCPAAQTLNADRTGAAKEVEDTGALDPLPQNAKERFLGTIGNRAGAVAWHCL